MQEWMGRVRREVERVGFHCRRNSWSAGGFFKGGWWRAKGQRTTFMHPSQELEQNVSFATKFQCTANTSLLCSFQD